MKKSVCILLLIFSITKMQSQSKGSRIGAQVGVGESWFTNSSNARSFDNLNAFPKLFFSGGLAASHQFTRNFGLMGNVLLSSKGQSLDGQTKGSVDLFGNTSYYKYEDTYRLIYTEIPVMAKVSLGFDDFYVKAFAGPSLGFNLHSSQQRTYEDKQYNDENGFMKTVRPAQIMELSAVAGLGIDMELKNEEVVFIDFRFNNALTSWGKINNQNAYNNYFSVSAGYLMK